MLIDTSLHTEDTSLYYLHVYMDIYLDIENILFLYRSQLQAVMVGTRLDTSTAASQCLERLSL